MTTSQPCEVRLVQAIPLVYPLIFCFAIAFNRPSLVSFRTSSSDLYTKFILEPLCFVYLMLQPSGQVFWSLWAFPLTGLPTGRPPI